MVNGSFKDSAITGTAIPVLGLSTTRL